MTFVRILGSQHTSEASETGSRRSLGRLGRIIVRTPAVQLGDELMLRRCTQRILGEYHEALPCTLSHIHRQQSRSYHHVRQIAYCWTVSLATCSVLACWRFANLYPTM
eukprot:Rmarinus@m.3963